MGEIEWEPNITFTSTASRVYHHIFRAEVSGAPETLAFTYRYFGLCTCGHYHDEGSSDIYTFDPDHQWLLDQNNQFRTIGGHHAGAYWIVLEIDSLSANPDNYVFDNEDDGYSDPSYFAQNGSDISFIYPNSDPTATEIESLPQGKIYVLKYTVKQLPGGFNPIYGEKDVDKVFDGDNFREEPEIIGEISPDDITVYINGMQYSYAEYLGNTVTKNVGQYFIQYTIIGSGGSSTTCDNLGGAVDTLDLTLTIDYRKVSGKQRRARMDKTYDATAVYQGFIVLERVDIDDDINEIHIHTGIIDEINTVVTAYFESASSGVKDIIFEITGKDASNYIIEITDDDDSTTPNTVTGEIVRQLIEITTQGHYKVYDGNTLFDRYTIGEGNILPSAPVTVTAHFDSAQAGEDKTITFSINGQPEIVANYTMSIDGSEEDTYQIEDAIIYKKGIHITSSINTKVYDGTTAVTFTFDTTDIIEGDTVVIKAEYDNKNVGTNKTIIYSFLEGGDEANYKFGEDGNEDEPDKSSITYDNGIITQRMLPITWTDNRKHNIYNAEEHTITLSVTNIVYGDTLSGITGQAVYSQPYDNDGVLCYDITVSYTNIDAGSYRNAIDISDGNYALWGEASYDWNIARRQVTITWIPDELGEWDDDYATEYNGQVRSISYAVGGVSGQMESGVIEGEDLGISAAGLTAFNAGGYTATVSIGNGNYTILAGQDTVAELS